MHPHTTHIASLHAPAGRHVGMHPHWTRSISPQSTFACWACRAWAGAPLRTALAITAARQRLKCAGHCMGSTAALEVCRPLYGQLRRTRGGQVLRAASWQRLLPMQDLFEGDWPWGGRREGARRGGGREAGCRIYSRAIGPGVGEGRGRARGSEKQESERARERERCAGPGERESERERDEKGRHASSGT